MQRTKPPFRADTVGSLLRPAPLRDARARHEKGEISAADLKAITDREIETIVRRQEEIGLRAVTDGEFRRSWWHLDFYGGLTGTEFRYVDQGTHGITSRAAALVVVDKVAFPNDHPMLEDFVFLKECSRVMPKMTIPSPSVLHFRPGYNAIKSIYPDIDEFFDDLAIAYQKAIAAFYDVGCRYLQLDDTVWAYLCSEEQMAGARERGDDVERLPERYARMINKSLEEKPADMIATMHVCRGNFRSTWISSGGYEPVAEILLQGLNLDGYFLEYDTERAGGFEPLRFLPKGEKIVVLGLITSKSGVLEKKDDIRRRIDEATRFAPLEQFALSPQCGFASTEEGNILTEDAQWAKLAEIVEIADEVWG